jgi:hypothetical protein
MILNELVTVTLSSASAKHYRALGYYVPTYLNSNKKMVVKRGTKIIVSVKDLIPKSTVLVDFKCDVCGTVSKRKYYTLTSSTGLCIRCNGKLANEKYTLKNGDFTKDNVCKTCGKSIRRINDFCWECFNDQKRHKKNYCVDCGKQILHSSTRCQKCSNVGINNPSYNPDLTDELRIKKRHGIPGLARWRVNCLKRDEYTCSKCGYTGFDGDGILQVHHIENFKTAIDLRTDENNGLTFCNECHKKFHRINGKTKNNIIELNEFIGGIDV